MNEFYVYQHKTKDTKEIFYIGKGKGRRAFSTIRNRYWKFIVEKHSFEVEIIQNKLSEPEAFALEKSLTLKHNPRANMCLGGGGVAGYKHSPELLAHLSEISKGEKNAFYDKTHSKEVKEKLRNARLGKPTNFRRSPIKCLNNGTIYESVTQAAKELSLNTSWICRVLKGKLKHAKGFKFQYIGDMSCQG